MTAILSTEQLDVKWQAVDRFWSALHQHLSALLQQVEALASNSDASAKQQAQLVARSAVTARLADQLLARPVDDAVPSYGLSEDEFLQVLEQAINDLYALYQTATEVRQ